MADINIGDQVSVVSGPHEGRGGRVVYMRDFSIVGKDTEPYAIIEFQDTNNAIDHISVPARRCTPKR